MVYVLDIIAPLSPTDFVISKKKSTDFLDELGLFIEENLNFTKKKKSVMDVQVKKKIRPHFERSSLFVSHEILISRVTSIRNLMLSSKKYT
jgi:hypothetical protein